MPLIYSLLILIIRTGLKISATDSAFVPIRLYGINIDIVGMVVIIDAETTAHDTVFCYLPVQDDLNDDVKINALLFKCLVQFLCLGQISGESV